jgi:hypothetical protein
MGKRATGYGSEDHLRRFLGTRLSTLNAAVAPPAIGPRRGYSSGGGGGDAQACMVRGRVEFLMDTGQRALSVHRQRPACEDESEDAADNAQALGAVVTWIMGWTNTGRGARAFRYAARRRVVRVAVHDGRSMD